MRSVDDWYGVIAAGSEMPPEAARQLVNLGFVVLLGPVIPGGRARLSEAYDQAVSTADPRDVSVRSSTRVSDFVSRGPEFDGIYVYGPVLAACCRIIGRPFKLSTMLARRCRRSIQGTFIPREARAATDHAERICPETLGRIGDLAEYVLDVGAAVGL